MLYLEPPQIVWTVTEFVPVALLDRGTSGPADIDVAGQRWAEQEGRLAELRQLQDGWDGEDGRAPSRELLESVIQLLRECQETGRAPAPSRILATADGTIFIEWQIPPLFASLEVEQPFEGTLLIEREGYVAEFRVEKWLPHHARSFSQWSTPIPGSLLPTERQRGGRRPSVQRTGFAMGCIDCV